MMIHFQGSGSNSSPALSVILVHWDGMKKADPSIGWPALASVTVDAIHDIEQYHTIIPQRMRSKRC